MTRTESTVIGMPTDGVGLFVGAYTEKMGHVDGHARGISRAEIHEDTGLIGPLSLVGFVRNPAWVTISSDQRHLYAVSEVDEYNGAQSGAVHAFSWDDSARQFALVSSVLSQGMSPTHLAIDPSSRYLVVANFNSGTVASFRISTNGELGDAVDVVKHKGRGLDPVRQESSHPHQIVFDPHTGQVFVPDLGLDQIFRYDLAADGRLMLAGPAIRLPSGTGPRHILFDETADNLLVLGELNSTVSTLHRNQSGDFIPIVSVSTLPFDHAGRNLTAGFVGTSTRRHVFATNRGNDSIAMFGWDAATGSLALLAVVPTGGAEPRALGITPDDRYLIVGNQNSDNVAVFAIGDRGLTQVASVPSPSPACILVVD